MSSSEIRVALLKSGDYGAHRRETGQLPYRLDHLEGLGFSLAWTDSHLAGIWRRRVVAGVVARLERLGVPTIQTLALLPKIRSAEVTIAMFESEGHLLAGLRWARLPIVRQTRFAIITCWLSALLETASARKMRWYRRLYSSVDVVFVLSSAQVAPTAAALDLPEGRVRFVHLGVDHRTFQPEDATDGGYVLAAGRDAGRDWPTLFEAVASVAAKVKVLARPRDVAGLTIPPNVEFLGYRPFAEYRRLLLGARTVVVCTRRRAYPTGQTVMLEAMAAAKPVVVTQTEAMRDYVAPERAVFVEPGDAQGVAGAVNALQNDSARRMSLGREGRAFVETTANAERMWSVVADAVVGGGPT